MSELPWYKKWFNSPFYHKLYFERDEQEAADFISHLLKYLKPDPGSLILDVACGRGRHSLLLAKAGHIVTGIDLASDSIKYAKKKAEEEFPFSKDKIEFFQHDIRLPFRVNYYDFAFNFFTSFGYFRTRREHEDAIRTIAQSLKPGGIFLIDFLNFHYVEDHLIFNNEKTIDGTHFEIHRWQDETHFYKKIIISDPMIYHPEDYTEIIYKFSLGDFVDMFSYHGLQVQQVFGSYQLDEYDTRQSPRMILVAKKL